MTDTAQATYKVGDRLHFRPTPERAPFGTAIGEGGVIVTEVVDHGTATPYSPRFTYVVRALDGSGTQGTDDRELSGTCAGCGRTFRGARGLRAHQSRRFITLACQPAEPVVEPEQVVEAAVEPEQVERGPIDKAAVVSSRIDSLLNSGVNPKARCTWCETNQGVTTTGVVYTHMPPGEYAVCPGSGRRAASEGN